MTTLPPLPPQAGWALEMHGNLVLFANNEERSQGFSPGATTPVFTADQMRAYGAACAAAERERIAQWLDGEHDREKQWHNYAGWYADQIRALKESK